jgi:hypothetical protein
VAPEGFLDLVRWAFAVAAVVLMVKYVALPVWRILRHKPEGSLQVPDYRNLVEGAELEIPTPDESKAYDRGSAVKAARADPHATAQQVRRWLKQKQ